MHYKTTVMTSLVDLVFVEVIVSTRQRLFGKNDKNDAPFVTHFLDALHRLLSERSLHPFVSHDTAEISEKIIRIKLTNS